MYQDTLAETDPMKNMKNVAKIALFIFLGVFALILLVSSFSTVEAGERGVRTRWGAITGEVVEPGFYFLVPFADKVNIIDVQTQTITQENLSSASNDLQDVGISVVVNYHIVPNQVQTIYERYKSTATYEASVIQPLIIDIVKSISPQYKAEELVTKRAEFNDKVTRLLMEKIAENFAVAERVNITNIQFSKSYTEAIEAKVTAKEQALKAENDLARVKFEADQKIEQARGEAESIRIQAEAISSQPQYVEKIAIDKWNGVLPQIILGEGATPFIDIRSLDK